MSTIGIPAPIGGWNARDALDSMDPTDAIELINWFPQPGTVNGRGGSLTKLTIGTSPIDTLANFSGATINQLVAATNGALYNVDPVGATFTSIGTGFTSNQWQWGNFNNKLVLANGADMPQVWDGTTLSNINANLFGAFTITVAGATTGGTLAAGVHAYRVTSMLGTLQSTPCPEVTVTNTGSTSANTITIPALLLSTGCKVYGRTAGAELLMATLAAGVLTWVDDGSISPSGAMPTTDTTPTILAGMVNFKGRAFYWANNVQGFWYAIAGAYQGALAYFPLDLTFREGGSVVQICTWSRDSGDGVDDLCAIISTTGECLVYQGLGPDITLQWSLSGRFSIGAPLSIRAHAKISSAEIIVTNAAILSLDEAIANQQSQELSTFGGKIIRAANSATQAYVGNFGWECCFYPRGDMFLVNVPVSATQYEQYVVNSNTGSWCRFTGWNARTFCVFKTRLYFGDPNGNIVLADTGLSDNQYGYGDNGNPVLKDATQAYLRLTQPGMKTQITGVQLVTNMSFPTKASINIIADYGMRNLPNVVSADLFNSSYWDVSHWDTFYFAAADTDPTNAAARPVNYSINGYGFALAISYRYSNMAQQLVWYSTNVIFKQAGIKMPDNLGVFTRTDGTFTGATVWTQEKAANDLITAAHFDTHDQDIANALNNRVFKDGTTTGVVSLNLTGTVNATTGVITIGGINALAVWGSPLFTSFGGGAGNFSFSGDENTAFGQSCMSTLTTGTFNVAMGYQALQLQTTAGANTAIGGASLNSVTTGGGNTAIGANSGNAISTGTDNTTLGLLTGHTISTGSNNVVIGAICDVPSASASGQVNIACTLFGTGCTGTGSTPGTGKLGVNVAAPTANLHLPASTTAAGSSPLKITAGTLMTTPENGAIEFDGTHFYITIGGVRKQLDN